MATTLFDPSQATCPLWKLIAPSLPYKCPPSTCSLPGCSAPAPLTCGGCQKASYCSKEHQRKDWARHRRQCSPFKIVSSPGVGRHLVATRDISPGEVILTEVPITCGPKQYTAPVCLGCHKFVPLSGYRCPRCDWPMCDEKCANSPLHRAECQVFSQANLKPTALKRKSGLEMEPDMEIEHPIYECVTPLRVCLVRNIRPENWLVVDKMATHREERQLMENSLHNQHNIVTFLLKHAKLGEIIPGVTEEQITRATDVLDVNAFEIRGPHNSIRGLYPLTAMMNSSCSPNTQNSIDDKWVCRVRAARKISKGEEICDTYTSTLSNTLYRRSSLKNSKYFDCSCKRCSDPTELGSHFSTLLCRVPGCGGYVVCKDPLDYASVWTCLKCHTERPGGDVQAEQEELEEKIENAPKTLDAQNKLLEELQQLFHPNHNLCVDVHFNLVPLLGLNRNYNLVTEAEKKLELVKNILDLMEKVIPGMFRMRGMFLAEFYTTNLFLLRSKLESKEISKSVFVRRLAGYRETLLEAKTILEFEPEGSIEAARLVSVNNFLAQLDQVVGEAGRILTE